MTYFFQTKQWADFWLGSVDSNHKIHIVESKYFKSYVYEYPWSLKQNFFYIPKGPTLQNSENVSKDKLISDFKLLTDKLERKAKGRSSSFIKFDFDKTVLNALGLKSNQELNNFLNSVDKATIEAKKSIQYKQTMVLNCSELKSINSKEISSENLKDFYHLNKDFWKLRNKNVNRYTKKSLKQGWNISTDKTKENFEAFWKVMKETAKRNEFNLYPEKYLQDFYNQIFARIIILRDKEGDAQGVWMGIVIGTQMVYVHGGNTQKSFKGSGQYLIHLIATFIAEQEKVIDYDLGGYDKNKGFGKFKENYKGEIVDFFQQYDLVLKPIKYKLTNIVISTVKKLLGR